MKAEKERFRIQADFCKAMAHPIRLEIVDLLKSREYTVRELAETIGASQANLSQHLAVLRNQGVVQSARQGNNVVYALADRKIVDACDLIREILTEHVNRQHAVIISDR